jgi:hypothetical protein
MVIDHINHKFGEFIYMYVKDIESILTLINNKYASQYAKLEWKCH